MVDETLAILVDHENPLEENITGCIFCRILNDEVPGTFVYRDADTAVFMDAQPVNPGHLLVVPTIHASCLADLATTSAGDLMHVAQQMAEALRQSDLRCEESHGQASFQQTIPAHSIDDAGELISLEPMLDWRSSS